MLAEMGAGMAHRRGIHCGTAALLNTFDAMGVTAPHSGQPFTEALLLGLSGGLGAGYILWEFKAHDSATLVIGFRARWNYAVEYMTGLCQRLNIPVEILEAGGSKAALANLKQTLAKGYPAPVWADKPNLPYHGLPERLKGYSLHIVAAQRLTDDHAELYDLAPALWTVTASELAAARAQVPSSKNRVLSIDPPSAPLDLPAAVGAGIQACIDHLSSDSESFSLPVIRKWAKTLTDSKNKKGWPSVFAGRKGLLDALTSVYEAVVWDQSDGTGLRGLYAQFLHEAADIMAVPRLHDAAQAYQAAGDAWRAFANAALPGETGMLADSRRLIDARYQAFFANQSGQVREHVSAWEVLRQRANAAFPLDDSAVRDLFADMQARLETVYSAEVTALETLKASL
ncbi:MAG: DUF4872 domain-containing protein [bacterium]|nr:DUF4872 domain-containing protein [bacterium]